MFIKQHSLRALLMVLIVLSGLLSVGSKLPAATPVDISVSLPKLPSLVDSKESGILVEFVHAINEVYKGQINIVGVYAFPRSIDNVISGKADCHLPILMNPKIQNGELPYRHSTEVIFHVTFALYTRRGEHLSPDEFGDKKIEVDRGHQGLFEIPTAASNSIETSLKKLTAGRIDGYIFAAQETDAVVKKLKLENLVSSRAYASFPVTFVLPHGPRGQEIDLALSQAITSLRRTEQFDRIFQPINDFYQNWQPLP